MSSVMIPHLPSCVLINNVMPYLDDRRTWNNMAMTCKCLHNGAVVGITSQTNHHNHHHYHHHQGQNAASYPSPALSSFLPPWPSVLKSIKPLNSSITALAFSPDGMYVACGSISQVDIWNIQSGHVACLRHYKLQGSIQSLVFSPTHQRDTPNGQRYYYLVICPSESNPQIWNVTSSSASSSPTLSLSCTEIGLEQAGGGRATDIAFCNHGKSMYIISENGLWTCDTILESSSLSSTSSTLSLSNGRQSQEQYPHHYNYHPCRLVYSLGLSRWSSELVSLSPSGQWLATSVYHSGMVKLVNLNRLLSSTTRTTQRHHDRHRRHHEEDNCIVEHNADYVSQVSFSPCGNYTATAGDHGIIQVWDIHGRSIHRLYGLEAHVTSVAFSSPSSCSNHTNDNDNVVVAASDINGYVMVWDIKTGRLLANLEGHVKSVNVVSFTTNGTMLSAAGADGTIRFWSRSSWS